MSDFDAEAERERLREKYERDEERRKETQQMSELLLKGATMTNRHCNDCGSPIFRYDGQEFCPSCQRVTAESDADERADVDGQAGQATANEQSVPDGQAGRATPDEQTTTATQPAAADRSTPREQTMPGEQATPDERGGAPEGTAAGADADDVRAEPSTVSPAATSGSATAADRGAREALLRALTRHAQLAEETDDPRRAKEHLSAAREAAEALDELE